MKEFKEIIGIVQKIKPTRKSLTINDVWYNSFTLLPEELNEGDKIKITFSERKVDNTIFHNIKSIELIEPEDLEIEETKNQDIVKTSKIINNPTVINTLIMTIKEIYISQEGKKSLKDITTDVIASYKQIVENISK